MRSGVCVTLPPELILRAKKSIERGNARTLSELVEKSLKMQLIYDEGLA
jgi:hypothetical protein